MLVCPCMDRVVYICAMIANFAIILVAFIIDFGFILSVTPASMGQYDAASFGFGLMVPVFFVSFSMLLLACCGPHEPRVPRGNRRPPRPTRQFPTDNPLFAQGGQDSSVPLDRRTDGIPKPRENGLGGYECSICWEYQMNLVAFTCSHVFCARCRNNLLKGVCSCPVCGSPTTAIGKDTREVVALSPANQ